MPNVKCGGTAAQDTESKKEDNGGCSPTPCCASSDTPATDAISAGFDYRGIPCLVNAIEHAKTLERALHKFMAVTETSADGVTQMATIEGRVKFYDRLRTVRAEAHGILSHNV